MSPPIIAISLTVLDEIKLYFGLVVKNTVLISVESAELVCESCISYSKSETARKPLSKIFAPFFFAYSTVSPSNESTSTFFRSFVLSLIKFTRSSTVKNDFFPLFLKTAIITLSNISQPVFKTSKCPFVIGSKLPGYIAIFINFLSFYWCYALLYYYQVFFIYLCRFLLHILTNYV